MTDKQPAPGPSASELRQEALAILDRIKVTAVRQDKRLLAVRAFELVQLAEQLELDEQRHQGSRKRSKVEGA